MEIADMFAQLKARSNDIRELDDRFHTALGLRAPCVMTQFNQLNTLEDKFSFMWNLPEAQRCLTPPNLGDAVKSEDDGERLRTEGNIFYKKNKLESALKCYNKSILLAPHPKLPISTVSGSACDDETNKTSLKCILNDTEEYKTLALGYANRSALFLRMKEYKKCLLDIDLALEYGYPELLRSKLTERRERCLNAQKQSVGTSTEPESIYLNEKKLPVLAEPSQTIPSFSNALKLAYSPARGRHVVAVRDIHPGDLIAVEKSYCGYTQYNQRTEYCSVCLMTCNNPLPCPDCVGIFCSDTCRTEGLQGSHTKECIIHPALFALGLEGSAYTLMAIMIVLHTPFAELKEKLPLLRNEGKELPPEKLGYDENGIYNSTDYRTVYHIAAVSQKSEENIYKMCILACVLTKMLYESGDVVTNRLGLPLNPSVEDIMLIGTVLLHHLCYELVPYGLSDVKISSFGQTAGTSVSTGAFPSMLLMKHSCNGSAGHYNIGHVKVIRSRTLIPSGKEVTLRYSLGFSKSPKYLRNMELERLGVRCSCEACEDDWATFDDLPKELILKCLKCSNPVGVHSPPPTCSTCDINYGNLTYKGKKKALVKKWLLIVGQVKEAEEKFNLLSTKINTNQSVRPTKEDFNGVCKFIVLMEKHIQLPCQTLCRAQDAMVQFYFYI